MWSLRVRQQSTLDFWALLGSELSSFVSALVVKYECPEIVSPDAFLGGEA